VAILKTLKTKSTTLSDDLFLCQVSKGSAVQLKNRNWLDKLCAVAMETKKGGFKKILDSFNQTL
jgi:hypothetical protein